MYCLIKTICIFLVGGVEESSETDRPKSHKVCKSILYSIILTIQ